MNQERKLTEQNQNAEETESICLKYFIYCGQNWDG